MIKPGTAIERPGEGGYFGHLAPAAAVGDEGGAPSAGTASSTSSTSIATNSKPGQTRPPKPARTTANR